MDHITLTHCTKICWTRLHLQSFIWNLPRSKCYMHYNPLLFWGKLYMRVISHHTWIVTTHPDSLVQVEQWMVHSTFFLNLPTNITNQRFTTTLKVREEKRLSYYGTKLKRLRHSLICTHTTWNQRQNFETYQSILIH